MPSGPPEVITVSDVERLHAAGGASLRIGTATVVTPAARERMRDLGIHVGDQEGGSAGNVLGAVTSRIETEIEYVRGSRPHLSDDEVAELVLARIQGQAPALQSATVSQHLAAFVTHWSAEGVPDEVVHESKRLVLNNLKASVRAIDHPATRAVLELSAGLGVAGRPARVLWHGNMVPAEAAALVNAVQMEVLDFNETYVPTYIHTAAAVAPAVLAEAEARDCSGKEMLAALAIGIEVELAISRMLMPSHYARGFNPTGTSGGIGATAACAALAGLTAEQTTNALGTAMTTAGGLFEVIGSMGWPYSAANGARTGVMAVRLAESGFEVAPTAFEGEKGMFGAYSDEDPAKLPEILGELGVHWRMLEAGYKRFQAETIDQAPLECVLAIRERTSEPRPAVRRMRFRVEPVVADVADERFRRFGTPQTDLEATFDLRYVMAAAWILGRAGGDVYTERNYRDPDILDLRSRIDVAADESVTLDGAELEIEFVDGTSESVVIEAWTGSARRPFSDADLTQLFLDTAAGEIPPNRARDIARAVMSVDGAESVRSFTRLILR